MNIDNIFFFFSLQIDKMEFFIFYKHIPQIFWNWINKVCCEMPFYRSFYTFHYYFIEYSNQFLLVLVLVDVLIFYSHYDISFTNNLHFIHRILNVCQPIRMVEWLLSLCYCSRKWKKQKFKCVCVCAVWLRCRTIILLSNYKKKYVRASNNISGYTLTEQYA